VGRYGADSLASGGDAYRLGQRRRNDPNGQTTQDLVRDAMVYLELALRGIADAARSEDTRAVSMLFAGSIRSRP
jgi:hypothetical protein